MDLDVARHKLGDERAGIRRALGETDEAGREDRAAENETGDVGDRAQPLIAEGVDDAIAATLRDRLAALDRAEQRIDAGTYGRSIRSGVAIPEGRLDADPAAELTVEEAEAAP
jgi:DnaK suppressor protein